VKAQARARSLPGEAQTIALKAAILEGEGFHAAWKLFRRSDPLTAPTINRLLPLIYQNALAHGISDPLLAKFKAVYLVAWRDNLMRVEPVPQVLKALRAKKIDCLFLKGVAMNLLAYKDFGLHPMGDVDILVPRDKARAAIDFFWEQGWELEEGGPWGPGDSAEKIIELQHAVSFWNKKNTSVDLHWRATYTCPSDRFDTYLWKGARQIKFRGEAVRVLNPTDQFLHLCLHGAAGNFDPERNCHWVADAMVWLKSQEIDWNRLVKGVETFGLSLWMREVLKYLREEFSASIPDKAMKKIYAVRPSRMEALEYRLKSEERPKTILGAALFYVADFWRNDLIARGSLPKILAQSRMRWGVKSNWKLGQVLVGKALRYTAKPLRRPTPKK